MVVNQELNNPVELEIQLSKAFEDLRVSPQDSEAIGAFLEPLKQKDKKTYEHCVRVALLTKNIGGFMKVSEKALLFAGLLHDVGKSNIPTEILEKTDTWTEDDHHVVEQHVMKGYETIKGRFDFTAEIILLHHKFQEKGYPEKLPSHLHNYSMKTRVAAVEYARILALADVYDALHRENCRFGEKRCLSEDEIKEKMFEFNPDRKDLIEGLYKEGIFH